MNRRMFLGSSFATSLLAAVPFIPNVVLAHIERLRTLKLFSCVNYFHCQMIYVLAYSLKDAKEVLASHYAVADHPQDEWMEYHPDEKVMIQFTTVNISVTANAWCNTRFIVLGEPTEDVGAGGGKFVGGKRGVIETLCVTAPYHLWTNGQEIAVAYSAKHAEHWYLRETGVTKEEYEHWWEKIPDEKLITIADIDGFDGPPGKATKTAKQWCEETHRCCVIASSEY